MRLRLFSTGAARSGRLSACSAWRGRLSPATHVAGGKAAARTQTSKQPSRIAGTDVQLGLGELSSMVPSAHFPCRLGVHPGRILPTLPSPWLDRALTRLVTGSPASRGPASPRLAGRVRCVENARQRRRGEPLDHPGRPHAMSASQCSVFHRRNFLPRPEARRKARNPRGLVAGFALCEGSPSSASKPPQNCHINGFLGARGLVVARHGCSPVKPDAVLPTAPPGGPSGESHSPSTCEYAGPNEDIADPARNWHCQDWWAHPATAYHGDSWLRASRRVTGRPPTRAGMP